MDITYKNDDGSYDHFIKELFFQYKTNELQAHHWPQEMLLSLLETQYELQEKSYKQQYPGAINLILFADGIPAGRLLLDRGNSFHIVTITLHNNFQRKRIGNTVIHRIMEQAKAENKNVTLKVHKHNPALRLYERLGFSITSQDEVYISMATNYAFSNV